MKKTPALLVAGAALALTTGVAVARDAADQARAEAQRDAAAAVERTGSRHVHIYRAHAPHERPARRAMVFRSGEDREQRLKDVLQLRPNQEPALKAFLDATRPEPHGDRIARLEKGAAKASTVERLAEMEARADAQHAAMKRRIAATRAFYAQLDERQKKAFDAMPMVMMAAPGFGPMLIPAGHMPPPPPPPTPPPAPPGPPAPPPEPGDI